MTPFGLTGPQNLNTNNTQDRKDIPKFTLLASWSDAMIYPQWLELLMSRTNFHGPNNVRAIEVRLSCFTFCGHSILTFSTTLSIITLVSQQHRSSSSIICFVHSFGRLTFLYSLEHGSHMVCSVLGTFSFLWTLHTMVIETWQNSNTNVMIQDTVSTNSNFPFWNENEARHKRIENLCYSGTISSQRRCH